MEGDLSAGEPCDNRSTELGNQLINGSLAVLCMLEILRDAVLCTIEISLYFHLYS